MPTMPLTQIGKAPSLEQCTAEDLEEMIKVYDEFAEFLNDMAGVHWFSLLGVHELAKQTSAAIETIIDLPETTAVGLGSPGTKDFLPYSKWPTKELPTLLGPGGRVSLSLGHLWVVGVYSAWEDGYRERLAKATGVEKKEIAWSLVGDLRHLRNDIIHHHGIASEKHSGKCVVLQWTTIGQPITIHREMIFDFTDMMVPLMRLLKNVAEQQLAKLSQGDRPGSLADDGA